MSFVQAGFTQEVCFPISEAQIILRDRKECELDRRELDLLRQQLALKDQAISNLEKELSLARQEVEIKDKIIAVKDMEIEAHKKAFADMKDISDRALKLAETSSKLGNWQLMGLIGIAAFALGLAAGL